MAQDRPLGDTPEQTDSARGCKQALEGTVCEELCETNEMKFLEDSGFQKWCLMLFLLLISSYNCK